MPIPNESIKNLTNQSKPLNNKFSSTNNSGTCGKNKQKDIERCVGLLEHMERCPGSDGCEEGEECRRTRQVLAHHRRCPRSLVCVVCSQLRVLCMIHAQRCKNYNKVCLVPYCHNEKLHSKASVKNFTGENQETSHKEKLRQINRLYYKVRVIMTRELRSLQDLTSNRP